MKIGTLPLLRCAGGEVRCPLEGEPPYGTVSGLDSGAFAIPMRSGARALLEEGCMPVSNDELKGLYYYLNLVRTTDERCRRLFKQGRFHGTYFSAVGQEATVVGPCYGLRPEDVIGIQHREIGAVITKGMPLKYIMAQLFARKDSPDRGKSHPCHY